MTTRWPSSRLVPPRSITTRRTTRRLVAPRFPLSSRSRRLGLPPPIAGWRTTRGFVAPPASARPRIRQATARLAGDRRSEARLVAIALRGRIVLRPRALGTVFLLESIARIFVRAAGTPVAAPPFRPLGTVGTALVWRGRRVPAHLKVVALRLARRPQPPPREPRHRDVGVPAPQLRKRRQQLFALAGAEGRRLVVDQDRPVRVTGRHPAILSGSGARGWRELGISGLLH